VIFAPPRLADSHFLFVVHHVHEHCGADIKNAFSHVHLDNRKLIVAAQPNVVSGMTPESLQAAKY
jgi:hypothetical protein